MISLPRSRQWLLPALILFICVLFYRSVIRIPASVKTVIRFRPRPQVQYGVKIPPEITDDHFMPVRNVSQDNLWPDQKHYYKYSSPAPGYVNPYLTPLLQRHRKPNPYTNHIRLPNIVQNVSQLTSPNEADTPQKFNPTIFALPPWSAHQYLLVSRVVTEGFHQESLLCEADTCYSGPPNPQSRRPGEKDCTPDDLTILGPAGGLRCATEPKIISIPPTPAEKCEGSWSSFPDIPGFHDPRIFWSGKGEPLIMVNSASRYACVGLWIADLRTLHEPLEELLASQPGQPYHPGPLMSYPSLTELTRNPASTRASVEKNWFLFFPRPDEAFLHYDLSIPRLGEGSRMVGGRTFAKVIGNGFTTPNLTDSNESPCLLDEPDGKGKLGNWHQSSNALKLILCRRAEAEKGVCSEEQEGRAVHFAVMHRKFSNEWDLPLRYERFFVVWDARPPFRMLGMSRYPILMWNETASGWTGEENWAENEDDDDSTSEMHDPSMRAKGIDPAETKANTLVPANHSIESSDQSSPRKHLTKRTGTNNNTIPTTSPPDLSKHPRPNRNWAYFTYTPSISWAFRPHPSLHSPYTSSPPPLPNRHRRRYRGSTEEEEDETEEEEDPDNQEHTRILEALNVGYLDDEVVLGIGVDDQGQGWARARAEELLGCLRRCGDG